MFVCQFNMKYMFREGGANSKNKKKKNKAWNQSCHWAFGSSRYSYLRPGGGEPFGARPLETCSSLLGFWWASTHMIRELLKHTVFEPSTHHLPALYAAPTRRITLQHIGKDMLETQSHSHTGLVTELRHHGTLNNPFHCCLFMHLEFWSYFCCWLYIKFCSLTKNALHLYHVQHKPCTYILEGLQYNYYS